MSLVGRLFKVLLIVLAIPAIGFLVSAWITYEPNTDLANQGLPTLSEVCAINELFKDVLVQSVCDDYKTIFLLSDASIFTAFIGMLIPILYWVTSIIVGKSRRRMARLFPPLVPLSLILISFLVLLHGAILTYAAYLAEAHAIERVHFFIIGAVGVGALVGAIKLISVSFTIGKRYTTGVFGKSLKDSNAPKLFSFVRKLAEKLGARTPNNIVVGLQPNFFVTSCDVDVHGEETLLTGETLYVSAPLARLMSKAELAAVVGHELGHFRGEDTAYSLKFAPVYSGLGRALGSIGTEENEGASGIAKLPALAILSFMYDLFSRNEAAISRERELLADQAGADVSSPLALVSSLIKISLYSGLWLQTQEHNVKRLNEGKITTNISRVFEGSARYEIEHGSFDDFLESIWESVIPHPTDTHPPISARLRSLEVDRSRITKDLLLLPYDSAIDYIDDYEDVEAMLTQVEHRIMVDMGYVDVPVEVDERQNYFLNATYCLAAAFVMADGRIDPQKIAVAESIGLKLIDGFDSVDFRDVCNRPDDMPDVKNVAEIVEDALTAEGKTAILGYLKAIAESGDDVHENEAALISRIAEMWSIEPLDPKVGEG